MIPKFLICDAHDSDRVFILHTQHPKFLAEVTETESQYEEITIVEWYDTPKADASELAKLMREVGDWYSIEISSY